MSTINKVNTKIKTAKIEPDATMDMILDILKTEIKADNTTTFNFLDMKLSALTSHKYFFFVIPTF